MKCVKCFSTLYGVQRVQKAWKAKWVSKGFERFKRFKKSTSFKKFTKTNFPPKKKKAVSHKSEALSPTQPSHDVASLPHHVMVRGTWDHRRLGPLRCSNGDKASARAPLQATIDPSPEEPGVTHSVRPPPTDLANQDHESCHAVLPCQLWVSMLFATFGGYRRRHHPPRRTAGEGPRPVKKRHHCGVDRELSTVEQRQPIHDDFKAPLIL